MRIPLLCSLILALAFHAYADEQKAAPETAAPPLLIAPQQPSTQAGKQPEWLPLPAPSSAPSSPAAAPLLNKPQAAPSASVQPATEPKKVENAPSAAPPPAKKPARPSQRNRTNATAKSVGPGNNVPPLIAAAVDESESAQQQASLWFQVFPYPKSLRQVTATPPLLSGIRSQHTKTSAEEPEPQITFESVLTKKLRQQEEAEQTSDVLDMLTSLVELQKNIKQQITVTTKKLKASASEAEKQALQEELTKLDKQLSETGADFERIATGVAPEAFSKKEKVTFSFEDELTALLEPSIKELKQLTARARQKSELKDTIADYNKQVATARRAVEHLNRLTNETKNSQHQNSSGRTAARLAEHGEADQQQIGSGPAGTGEAGG